MKSIDRSISRRTFIKAGGLTGVALTLGFSLPARAEDFQVQHASEAGGTELNAWISIDATGKVTLTNHRAEMGQGSFQSVPQMIAEELEVDLQQVSVVFAPGNGARYGDQVTGGSSTIRGSYERLLRLSASAREMLTEAAAKKWEVPVAQCYAESGAVIHRPSGRKLGYGELVAEASKLPVPKQVTLKDPRTYKLIRKPLPRLDNPQKINGQAIFGTDKRLPGMLFAVVERNPRFMGKVKSFNGEEVMKLPGVKHVLRVEREVFGNLLEGVAVVADSTWAALQARKALKVEWDDSGFEHLNTAQLYERMREMLKGGKVLNVRTQGNFENAFERAEKKVEALYETPYESHSNMEPLNCIAHVKEDSCEIWGPIQGPDWIQGAVAEQLKMAPEKVTVNMTFLGGGLGRKAFTDYPHEAVFISKAIKAPVQVLWTREDDMTAGPFRPGMIYQCRGAVSRGGRIAAFEVNAAGQNMSAQGPGADKTRYNGEVVDGMLKPYFESIPHYRFGDAPLDVPIPVMWWRSVYASTNAFAFESFLDEMAVAAGKDPLDFRAQHLGEGRYAALIEKLKEVSKWSSRQKNEGYGVAISESFGSVVGEVCKVVRNQAGKVRIEKVWAVMDCGWYVNPDIIRAQVEGSVIMALGAATKHATTFADGKAVEKNFDSYKMTRIADAPEIEVHIMDNQERAGGVGEPGLPPFTAALTNAIFDLTGKRIRVLPFSLDEV
ncbi:MAG: xanthine dehydrogenase family protein molybdopterin-binding subunit [Cyclobacteriaceae bacterium]|nr:xanthine dehydrogenase family protein molybdopterin-binding subunit [Cyclobacteriaceae bacterium]